VPIPTVPSGIKTICGEEYFVKTLNQHEMDSALLVAKSRVYEATRAYSEKPKGELYDAQLEVFASMTPQEQAEYSLSSRYAAWWQLARDTHPEPYAPDPIEPPDKNDELQATHLKEVVAANLEQSKFVEDMAVKGIEEALKMTEEDRLKWCMRAYRMNAIRQIETDIENAEIFSRAVKQIDKRTPAFTPEEYYDFTAKAKAEFLAAYRSFDTVNPTKSLS